MLSDVYKYILIYTPIRICNEIIMFMPVLYLCEFILGYVCVVLQVCVCECVNICSVYVACAVSICLCVYIYFCVHDCVHVSVLLYTCVYVCNIMNMCVFACRYMIRLNRKYECTCEKCFMKYYIIHNLIGVNIPSNQYKSNSAVCLC